MAFDPVPYFVGGGALHSPEVMRTLAYAATGGAEGVVTPGDLKVTPTAVPGNSVQVSVGAAVLVNRAAASANQSYVARMNTADTVQIAATTSSGSRTDLIVAQIEDPWLSGEPWQDPADPTVGPYVFTRVISNVPAGTTRLQDVSGYAGRTAVTLARITIPAATATITSAMITDLRTLARPRSDRQNYLGTPVDASTTLDVNVWRNFPTNPITGIRVPLWATHAVITMNTTMQYVSGNAYANVQAFMGPAGTLDSTTQFADLQIDTTTSGGAYRSPLLIPNDRPFAIPAAWRGTAVQISSRVRGNANGGVIATRAADYYVADVTFKEQVV